MHLWNEQQSICLVPIKNWTNLLCQVKQLILLLLLTLVWASGTARCLIGSSCKNELWLVVVCFEDSAGHSGEDAENAGISSLKKKQNEVCHHWRSSQCRRDKYIHIQSGTICQVDNANSYRARFITDYRQDFKRLGWNDLPAVLTSTPINTGGISNPDTWLCC